MSHTFSPMNKVQSPDNKDAHKPILAERFKTKMCQNYEKTGECPYEARCMFAHGDHELRTKQMNLNDNLVTEEAIKTFQKARALAARSAQKKDRKPSSAKKPETKVEINSRIATTVETTSKPQPQPTQPASNNSNKQRIAATPSYLNACIGDVPTSELAEGPMTEPTTVETATTTSPRDAVLSADDNKASTEATPQASRRRGSSTTFGSDKSPRWRHDPYAAPLAACVMPPADYCYCSDCAEGYEHMHSHHYVGSSILLA